MNHTSTIASISTPAGKGGIAIIRISGPASIAILEKVFHTNKNKYPLESHKLYLGKIIDPGNGCLIDQVFSVWMKKPHSYTTEDVVEIHCHGGTTIAAKILEMILKEGAEPAEAGEFTKRAFLGGRIDLAQAEAVCDLINAVSDRQIEMAARQLEGGIGNTISELFDKLLELIAHFEVAIDFPDDDQEIISSEETVIKIKGELIDPLNALIQDYKRGRVFREGVKVVIAGRPNVGKSSLLNALVGKDKAIVTDIPGTTRDIIEAETTIKGIPVRITDTAGLEEAPRDRVEAMGQKRALDEIRQADVLLVVFDQSQPMDFSIKNILKLTEKTNRIVVLNKNDLDSWSKETTDRHFGENEDIITISALQRQGLEFLLERIFLKITNGLYDDNSLPSLVPNLRHTLALEKAVDCLNRALESIENELSPDLTVVDLKDALDELGLITGKTTSEDLLDQIFNSFCLGK